MTTEMLLRISRDISFSLSFVRFINTNYEYKKSFRAAQSITFLTISQPAGADTESLNCCNTMQKSMDTDICDLLYQLKFHQGFSGER